MEHHSLHEAMQALLSSLFCDFYDTMQGWLYAAIAFILADLRFGILAAKKRGDEIRGSRMRRRTMNKVLDYSCWMFVAYTCRNSFGALFGVPVVSAAIVMYVYLNELASIGNNYADYKGLKKKLNFWKLVPGRHDIERALEDVEPQSTVKDESVNT